MDNCLIGSKATILHNAVIGNNCSVGANCVVFDTVPDNATVVLPKPRIIINPNRSFEVQKSGEKPVIY